MLTDIQGYSKLSSEASRSGITNLVEMHNNLIRPIIDYYDGKIIKSLGDAFLCTFESATNAAICSMAIRAAVAEYNRNRSEREHALNIRVMINSGDVTLRDNDIFGDPVNIVSRMEKLDAFAKGGIGISESTYLLMNRQEIKARFLGEFEMKGISYPVKVYSIYEDPQHQFELPKELHYLIVEVATGRSGSYKFIKTKPKSKVVPDRESEIRTFAEPEHLRRDLSQKVLHSKVDIDMVRPTHGSMVDVLNKSSTASDQVRKENQKIFSIAIPQAVNHDPRATVGQRIKAHFLNLGFKIVFLCIAGFIYITYKDSHIDPALIGAWKQVLSPEQMKLFLEAVPIGLAVLFYFCVDIISMVMFEGQTFGKKIVGIAVVNRLHEAPDFFSILLRETVGWLLEAATLFLGLLFIFRKDRRTLHDMLAGTRVINV